jgi:hypothetical protein
MANTFLTSKEIAMRALPVLSENLVMPALANVDYSGTFASKGDTIQVKRPAVFIADEFGSTINLQDINPFPVLVKMDKIADVSVEVTAAQLALNIEDFNSEVLEPAVVSLAEKINQDGLGLYQYVPNFVGAAGTTPDAVEDFANAAKKLNDAKAPTMNRFGVWDTASTAKFQVLDAIVGADKSGTTLALREGAIGKIFGMNNYMSQAIKTHTAGGYTALADVTVTADDANNAVDTVTGFTYSSFVLTSAAGTATTKLEKGDLITVGTNQYTVIEQTAAAISGVVTAKVFPKITADLSAVAVTFPDVTARAHVANLAFNKNAFGFVTRPLEPAAGADNSTQSFGGLTIRVVIQYDINTKKTIMSIDTLYGWAPLYPELATRILG